MSDLIDGDELTAACRERLRLAMVSPFDVIAILTWLLWLMGSP